MPTFFLPFLPISGKKKSKIFLFDLCRRKSLAIFDGRGASPPISKESEGTRRLPSKIAGAPDQRSGAQGAIFDGKRGSFFPIFPPNSFGVRGKYRNRKKYRNQRNGRPLRFLWNLRGPRNQRFRKKIFSGPPGPPKIACDFRGTRGTGVCGSIKNPPSTDL